MNEILINNSTILSFLIFLNVSCKFMAIWEVIQAKDVFRRGQTDVDNQMVTPDCVDIAIPNKLFRSKKEY